MAGEAKSSANLSKLARLKSLKSGLNAAKGNKSHAPNAPARPAAAEPTAPRVAPKTRARAMQEAAPTKEAEPESLSDYFEALGVAPPRNMKSGKTPPMPDGMPSTSRREPDPAPEPKPKPQPVGRDLEDGDLWKDPVRDNPKIAASLVGAASETAEANLDDIIALGSAFESETIAPESLPEPDAEVEAFERAIAIEPVPEFETESADPPMEESALERGYSVALDAERTKLLEHVADQMNCSVDDIVVTALDWYLDALFGDDQASSDVSA